MKTGYWILGGAILVGAAVYFTFGGTSKAANKKVIDPGTGQPVIKPNNVKELTTASEIIALKDSVSSITAVGIVYTAEDKDAVYLALKDVAAGNPDIEFITAPEDVVSTLLFMSGNSNLVPKGAEGGVGALKNGEPLYVTTWPADVSASNVALALVAAVDSIHTGANRMPHTVSGKREPDVSMVTFLIVPSETHSKGSLNRQTEPTSYVQSGVSRSRRGKNGYK